MLFEPDVRFYNIYLNSRNRVAAYWVIAARSAYDICFRRLSTT